MNASPCPPRNADRLAAGEALPAPSDWSLSHIGFGDVLEALNPLHYLPGVGMIYRLVTGHHEHPALQIAAATAGALLFGGPIGLAASILMEAGTELFRDTPGPGASPAHVARLYAHASAFG